MKRGNIECMRFLAVFMVTLVISIPFLTSNAYASVQVIHPTGEDTIIGVKESLNVTVKVVSSQEIFTTNDIMIVENMGTTISPFNSCEGGVGGYDCNYQGSEEVRTPGLKKYCVCEATVCPTLSTLCPPQGTYSKDIMIKVDGEGPTVESASVNKIFISKEDPKVSFGIKDIIGGGLTGSCSGIKQVEIYVDGSLIDTEEVEVPSCTHNINNYKINNSDLPNGDIVICALPTDAVGNVRAEYREFLEDKDGAHCVGLTKDDRPPIFHSAKLLNPSGTTEITMISSNPTQALLEVQLNTFTHELENNQITADLTEIGAGTPTITGCEKYKKPGDNVSLYYNCSATVTLNIAESGTKKINLTAKDITGNTGSGDFSFSFTIDDFGPLVFDIMTDKPYFGTYLLGPTNNTVSFLIQEEGSGIDNTSIVITDGSNTLTEVSCGISEFYGAACVVEKYNPPAGASSVTFSISGKDNAGNSFDTTQLVGKNIIRVDKTAPEFRNATVIGQGPVVTEGSTVMIIAYMTDHYGFDVNGENVEAKFDFAPDTESYFPADACNPVVEVEEVPDEEEEEEEPSWGDQSGWDPSESNTGDGTPQEEEPLDKTWECFWSIPGVVNQGPNKPMTVMFKIRDLAENLDVNSQAPMTEFYFQFMDDMGTMWYGEELTEIEIYGLDPTIVGSWVVDVDVPVPNAEVEEEDVGVIDATVALVTPYRMWYPITVRSLASNIEAISVTLKKDVTGMPCYGEFFMAYGDAVQTNMQPMMDGDLLRNSLELVFLPSEFAIDDDADYLPFSAECAVGVISKRVGGDDISIEMIVPFNVTGVVHPYDDVADKVHDKIMGHYNWFLDEENTFTKIVMILQDIINFLTSICEVYSMLSAINVALGAIDNTIGVFAEGVKVLEGLSKGLNAINMGMEKVFKVVDVVASPLCSFLMCSEFAAGGRLPEATYNKAGEEHPSKSSEGKSEYGGTMPWCDKGYKALVDATTIEVSGAASVALQTKKISMLPNDIKQSLILSVFCICIPGILNGLMTWRNIECEYIECLYKDSTMNTQLYICDELYHYSMCKYFIGEIFEMLPFAKALETIFKGLAAFLKNPLSWILGSAAIACEFAPPQSTGWLICQAMDLVFQVAEAYNRVKDLVQRIQYWAEVGWTGGGVPDKCEKIIGLLNDDPRYFGDEDADEGTIESELDPEDDSYGADADDVDGGDGDTETEE